jgi:hypothetical protein
MTTKIMFTLLIILTVGCGKSGGGATATGGGGGSNPSGPVDCSASAQRGVWTNDSNPSEVWTFNSNCQGSNALCAPHTFTYDKTWVGFTVGLTDIVGASTAAQCQPAMGPYTNTRTCSIMMIDATHMQFGCNWHGVSMYTKTGAGS